MNDNVLIAVILFCVVLIVYTVVNDTRNGGDK
jgi:hypothetical protein